MKVNFEEVLQDITKLGTKVTTDKYQKQGDYPIIDQGQKFIAGYLNGHEGLLEDIPVIIFGDHTRVLKYVDYPFFLGADGVKVLKVKNTNFLSKYVYYNLCATAIPNTGYNRHFKWLKQANLKAIPLEAQQKIINSLDEITTLIEKYKQQLEKLDLLVKSKFIEMFGDPIINPNNWMIKGLMDIGECKNGINFGASEVGKIVKCIGVGDIKNLSVIDNNSNVSFVSLNELPSSEYLLQNEDIVFVRSNGNKNLVGRCVIVYPQEEYMTFSGFCIRFRKTTNIIQAQYLLYFLKQQRIRERIIGRGANIQNLNQKILSSLMIPIPPIELQNEFASFVEQTDKTKSKIKQSLEKFDILKKALMQKYFG